MNARNAVSPSESSTVTVTVPVPVAVGVPESVRSERVRPGGIATDRIGEGRIAARWPLKR